MAQVTMNIRMDADLKRQFELFCANVGMTMTTAVCVFAKMAVKEQRIPFEINADPFYGEENQRILQRRIAEYKANPSSFKEHELIEV